MNVTTDFSKFGHREREMAAKLLTASIEHGFPDGFPDDFEDSETNIMMNKSPGSVFFTNEDFQVCMMNGDKLESFYSCPVCGHEGFLEDMPHSTCLDYDNEFQEYLDEIRNT